MSAPDERPPRPAWATFQSALRGVGFHPSRRLGQNFLLDENMARAIVRDAGVAEGDCVLEVGPGCGFLSVHLAHLGVRLLCVEIDRRLAEVAGSFLAPYPEARVLRMDVLAGKHALAAPVNEWIREVGDWHLVSNLPYSISGPLLAQLALLPEPPLSVTVLVQKEVGERLGAAAGTAAYGPLSVVVQAAFDVEPLRALAPELFWPRPKVESLLVRLERRGEVPAEDARERLAQLTRALFQRRRQTLGRVLGELMGSRSGANARLERAGIDPGRRAETLSPEDLAALAED